MLKISTLKIILPLVLIVLVSLACASSRKPIELSATIAPITITSDLSLIDLCSAIPQEDIETVMGQELASLPAPFAYYDMPGTSGCSYDGGKDANGNAIFGYVALTPGSVYDDQIFSEYKAVSDLGSSAFFNNGEDARQLWVKVNDNLAFVVVFGDEPDEEGATAIARLLLEGFQ